MMQRFHGELRQRAEADLLAHHTVEQMKQTSGRTAKSNWSEATATKVKTTAALTGVKLNSREWDENVRKLAAMFGDTKKRAVDDTDDTGALKLLRACTTRADYGHTRQSGPAAEMIVWGGR